LAKVVEPPTIAAPLASWNTCTCCANTVSKRPSAASAGAPSYVPTATAAAPALPSKVLLLTLSLSTAGSVSRHSFGPLLTVVSSPGLPEPFSVARVVTPELAYVVWVEHHRGKVGERDEIVNFLLRVTIIFRLEDDTWKIVHRHTDTVIAPRPHESMIKE
jgi:hypothetical protein